MRASPKSRKAQHPLRIAFRWCRISFLLFIVVVIGCLFWANIFGLPGWVRAEIQQELQGHSIHLEFAKLQLRGFRHIIARDVRLQSDASTNSLNFTVREAEFLIDFQQL